MCVLLGLNPGKSQIYIISSFEPGFLNSISCNKDLYQIQHQNIQKSVMYVRILRKIKLTLTRWHLQKNKICVEIGGKIFFTN